MVAEIFYEPRKEDSWLMRVGKGMRNWFVGPLDPEHTLHESFLRRLRKSSLIIGAAIVAGIGASIFSPSSSNNDSEVRYKGEHESVEHIPAEDIFKVIGTYNEEDSVQTLEIVPEPIRARALLQQTDLENAGLTKIGQDHFAISGGRKGDLIAYSLGLSQKDSTMYGITILEKDANGKFHNKYNFFTDENGNVSIPEKFLRQNYSMRVFAGTKKDGRVTFRESVALSVYDDARTHSTMGKTTKNLESYVTNLGLEKNYSSRDLDSENKKIVKAYVTSRVSGNDARDEVVADTFDATLAPDAYFERLKELYADGSMSVRAIAQELSSYGIPISSSTVSKYGRRLTGTQNRREAQEKYEARKTFALASDFSLS